MLRAFFTALFVLLFVRFAVWAARLLTGGRRDGEIPPGSSPGRTGEGERSGSVGGSGGSRRRAGSRRVAPGEIVDVPFTEVPPPESPKRT
jgi:hypothetical protein